MITTVIIVLTLIVLYYRYFFGYWKSRNVYTLPPNILFGNITNVIFGKTSAFDILHEAYMACKEKGYRYIGFYFLGKPILIIRDPELLKNVFAKDFVHFTDREFYANEQIDPLSLHIVSMTGIEWKTMRQKLSPVFTSSKLKMMYKCIAVITKQMEAVVENEARNTKTINLNDIANKYVLDVIGTCIFGIDCNTLQGHNSEFQQIALKVLGGSLFQYIKLFMSMLNPKVLYFLRIPYNSADVQKYFLNLVKTTVEYREKNNITRLDMMQSLIQLRNNNVDDTEKLKLTDNSKKQLTIEQIAAEALIFFGAGCETTTSVVMFCVYQMICNPTVQQSARNEVKEVLRKHNGEISFDSIAEMSYLEMCITETIRYYPPGAILARICTKDYQIPNSNVVIEKGTAVFVPSYEIHQDPEFYPEPTKFIPERFSPENCLNRPQYVWLGYGEGPHNCIGRRFSLLLTKSFLCYMLKNYNFSISSLTKLPLEMDRQNIILNFKQDLFLNIEKIQDF